MANIVKKRFKIAGMHCHSCVLLVDGDLEDVDGVKMAKTNYAKSETEVEFDSDKVTLELILKTIEKTGYGAVSLEGRGNV